MPAGFHPIVADNGSTDASANIAADHGATVVRVPQRGFGAACHAGLLTATSEVVCFMDADASLDPGDLPLVADPILVGQADLVLGRRVTHGLRTWPLHARLGTWAGPGPTPSHAAVPAARGGQAGRSRADRPPGSRGPRPLRPARACPGRGVRRAPRPASGGQPARGLAATGLRGDRAARRR